MKRLMCLVLSLILVIGLVACGGDKPTSNTPGTSTPSTTPETPGTPAKPTKDTITFAYETEPSSISPFHNDQIAAYYITYLLNSGLFKNTVNGVEPDLCTEYKVEKDANGEETIWVMKLREGVKFSDGSDLTSQDVVDSLLFARDGEGVSSKSLAGFIKNVETDGDYGIKLYTNGVFSAVPSSLANKKMYIVPSEQLKDVEKLKNAPIGSGPYKLVKWNKGESLEMTINEHYYDKDHMPTIKNINWKILAEGTSRTMSLEAGETDFVISVDALDLPRLQKETDKYTVSITNGSMYCYLLTNNNREPFNDVNFRRFLGAAINREDIIDVALGGYGTPIYGGLNIVIDGCTEEGATKYDPAKAKEYLKAWGGDPSKVEFDIVVATDVRRRMAEVIQNALLEYGIKCNVQFEESANVSKMTGTGEFDTIIFAYTTNDYNLFLKQLYYPVAGGSMFKNTINQKDASKDAAVEAILKELDPAKRTQMITELNKVINPQQLVTPLYCCNVLLAYNKNLSGVEVDSMGFFRVEDFRWN